MVGWCGMSFPSGILYTRLLYKVHIVPRKPTLDLTSSGEPGLLVKTNHGESSCGHLLPQLDAEVMIAHPADAYINIMTDEYTAYVVYGSHHVLPPSLTLFNERDPS